MNHQRSSAIATVMFTDVEASTQMTTRLGDDAAGRLLATHDRIVRDHVAAHGGRHIRSTGDGFLVVFDSARGAVACALSIEDDLAAHEEGIRVRIGLHAGEVREGEGELFGGAVNLAARVMARAHGGQILATDAVRQLTGTMPEARFRDRGRVALKGIPGRQRVYEVHLGDGRPHRRATRRRRLAALAGAALAVAVATAVILAATGGEEAVEVRPNSVAILDPDDGRVVGQVPVGVRPGPLAVDGNSVWVANTADHTVTQIGSRSRRVVGTVSPGIAIDGLAAGPSGLWATDSARSTARVIDPAFRTVARSVRLGEHGSSAEAARPLAVTKEAAWVAYGIAEIARLEPESGRVIERLPVGNRPSAVAVTADAVWVTDERDGTVLRIDPRTNAIVTTIPVGQSVSGIAVGAGGVWVPVPLEDRVKRIDPASNAVNDTVRVGGGPAAVAVGAGAVWVTSRRGGTVARIDPRAARVTRTVRLGHSPQGIAIVDGAVWVAVQASLGPATAAAAGRSADVLTVLRPEGLFGGTDPALALGGEWLYPTCALLLNYPDRPFPEGARMVPEVASAMPTVSDNGRTYTFRLRDGFRFSPPSNAPVTAAAFRRAIERALHPRSESYAPAFMSDIVGVDAYRARRAKRLAGVTVRGDTLTIRLKTASATLPARLASSFFCAVPPTTPISPAGIERIPMAGPYYIASYVPEQRLVLRRNPNYRGGRPARMREIDIDLDVAAARAVDRVEAGRADYVSNVPPARVGRLERRYGPDSGAARSGRQRYFSGAEPLLHFFALNANRPLLASTRMRQAVSAALDRTALARGIFTFGSTGLGVPGRPTDQFIPPGLPGFHDAAIYPLGAPDLERARRLAGSRRRRAVLYTCNLAACLEHGRVARRNLAAIGLDVEVKNFSLDEMFTRMLRPGEPWDIGYQNFLVDYADPEQYVAGLFPPTGRDPNVGGFRDEAIQRRIRAAKRITDLDARARAFAQLDEDLSRAGAAVPFATGVTTDFFSDRIGCQVHQPIYGISLGALCARDQ